MRIKAGRGREPEISGFAKIDFLFCRKFVKYLPNASSVPNAHRVPGEIPSAFKHRAASSGLSQRTLRTFLAETEKNPKQKIRNHYLIDSYRNVHKNKRTFL